jgi:SAM-dependent methyltransferase
MDNFSQQVNKLDKLLVDGTSDKELENWSRNYLHNHKKRYQHDIRLIKENYQTGRILELGSAPFHLTNILKEMELPVTGVDIAPERFDGFIKSQKLEVVKCNVETEKLPFKDNEFHLILFNEIFEHLRINPIATLREINRVLHPDGILILTTPNLYSIRNVIHLMLGKGFDDPYDQFKRLEEIGHMGHVREYSGKQVKKFLTNTGFKSRALQFKSFDTLKGSWIVFTPLRKLFSGLNSFQIHVCSKAI